MPQSAGGSEQKPSTTNVWDGVYAAAQAQRGNTAYLDKCAGCHRDDLSGYQGVLKSDFMRLWREDNLQNLYTIIKNTMPRSAPASLSDGTYLDILTFILQANDFPAGAHELTMEALPNIQIEEKSGKLEVPDGTLVDVIGCLVENSDNSWVLNLASEPIRIRDPNNSTAEQLKAWEAKPLGTRKFGLMDAAVYHPESLKGHKIEAKGFLIKKPNDDRINLTALQMTDSMCDR
jgi:hypothetical protein